MQSQSTFRQITGTVAACGLALLLLAGGLARPPAVHAQASTAAEDIPCAENALRAAIEAATLRAVTLPQDCFIILTTDLPAVTKPFTVNGGGAILDGSGEHRAFRVAEGGALTLTGLTLQYGSGRLGGALYVGGGSASVAGVTFLGNAAFAGFGGGAVLVSGGDVTIADSAFVLNTSVQLGGAVSVFGGDVTITNSTFSGNSAASGGALSVSGGSVTVTSSTLVGNRAQRGGGLYQTQAGELRVGQSIIAANNAAASDDVYHAGGLASDGYNLFSDTEFGASTAFAPTDLFTPSPETAPFTGVAYGLLASSLALDAVPAGDCAAEADQRGTERPQGTGCDIGAVEMSQTGDTLTLNGIERPEVVALDVPAEGECSLRAGADVFSVEVPADTYCRVLMRAGGWVNNPGSVPQEVIDRSVIVAVEVFSLRGGQALEAFDGVLPLCLRGEGQLLFLDAAQSPRVAADLPGVLYDGSTCAFVPAPGTVALVRR